MPQFAIVIPNLNQSRYLADALESLKHQGVRFNLAVMDGGSSDGFKQVAQQYSDIITYMQSCPDGGQARAIADGSELITGDFVSWLNADDYYFPGALDKVADFFEKNPHVDVAYGNAVHVKPDRSFLSYFSAIEDFDPKKLPFSCFICQPACFVRRSSYHAVGGINPALKYTMDWDLWCRLSAIGARFKYFHDVLAAVRYYPETKTLSGDKQRYYEIWRIGKKYGRRLLPVAWPGFYRFDLSFKKQRTLWEELLFKMLEGMRYWKKRLNKCEQKPLFGFYPWSTAVAGKCLIQFPWYGSRPPKNLKLRVFPETGVYHIDMGEYREKVYQAVNGEFSFQLPYQSNAFYSFQIRCPGHDRWKLVEVEVEE